MNITMLFATSILFMSHLVASLNIAAGPDECPGPGCPISAPIVLQQTGVGVFNGHHIETGLAMVGRPYKTAKA